MVLFTDPLGADKHIAFEKTDDDNPSRLKSNNNITQKCVCGTFRVEHLSV